MNDTQHKRIHLLSELTKKMLECWEIVNKIGKLEDEEVKNDIRTDK